MAVPRLKPHVLHSIYARPPTQSQIRCLRTKPGLSSPRQSAFGLPSISAVRKSLTGKKQDTGTTKIPIVPKFNEDEQPIKPTKVEQEIEARTKAFENMTPEEIAQARALQESEERLAQFERDKRANKGKSEQEVQRAGFDDQVNELNTTQEEKTDNIVYPRDVIGRKFKKEKDKENYKVKVNYLGFVSVPEHRTQMVQAAVGIIHDYQKHMNGEKTEEMLSGAIAAELPEGIVIDGVDTRSLSLPLPPEAILPTMRLVFEIMKHQVRFALSDIQINSIATGADFIKHLLNPPKTSHPNPQTFLYSQLQQIPFPANVKILPDRQLEKQTQMQLTAAKSRKAIFERQQKEAELLKAVQKNRFEQRMVLKKRREKGKLRLQEQEQALLLEQQKKEESYSQFYGRVR